MNRYARILALGSVGVGFFSKANFVRADGSPGDEPIIVLKGERDSELAPHPSALEPP